MAEPVRTRGGFAADAEAIWRAALAAVDPWSLVRSAVERQGDILRVKKDKNLLFLSELNSPSRH